MQLPIDNSKPYDLVKPHNVETAAHKKTKPSKVLLADKELVTLNKSLVNLAALIVSAKKEIASQKQAKKKLAIKLVNEGNDLKTLNDEKKDRAAESSLRNKKLSVLIKEKETISSELIQTNNKLKFENIEKEKRAAELFIANEELIFQNAEKEKRASELIIANNELTYQNKEKEQRAAELFIANRELVYQNEEKEKRAAELVIAINELKYQNNEKGKLAAELVLANAELVFQNIEKEKREAELKIANKELAFQNKEKENRAAELHVANEELLFQNSEKGKRALELEAANKELESFSYSVSHDLRAPLRAINGFTEVLMEDYSDQFNEEARELLNEIIANSKKMGELIDNLLEFSRIGKQHLSSSVVNVKVLVDSVITELMQTQPKRRVDFTLKPLENIKADRNMLKQVFLNLLSNALKYTGKKQEAKIEVGSYDKDDHRVYYVKDNGAGFDMRYYDKLFGVFQRLHSNNEFEGTGVGLAIIQKIVSKHAGGVWAEAEVNEGACFYISLPNS